MSDDKTDLIFNMRRATHAKPKCIRGWTTSVGGLIA